ncbi:MAG: endonuclease, partial [Oscillospiraceae bacterium]|nr:endonuclease [Oscillospiraceae bacterium]
YTEDGKSIGLVEVNDNIKGDVARILLYVYVRWGERNLFEQEPNPVKPSGDEKSDGKKVIKDLETLLEWCEMDPVDSWEMSRNDSVQGVQGNRNVFIDYPEFAWLLFHQEIPANMSTPSGNGSNTYTIKATSNYTGYGTVSVVGRTITAYPKTGYYAAGYTVVQGKATVTQNGNTFIVNAESDCTIRIDFAAKTAVTVDFNGAADPIYGYAGEAITLPYSGDPDGYRFLGWVESEISDTTVKPAFYAPGSSYTPSQNVHFYALYQHAVGGSGTGKWMLVNSADELVSGAELMIASVANGAVAGDIVTNYLGSVSATFSSDNSILDTPAETAMIFFLGGEENAWTLSDAEGHQLGAIAAKKLAWDTGTMTWKITVEGTNASIYSSNSSYGRILYNNNNLRFNAYTSTPTTMMSLPQLYKRDGSGGTVYYTTELVSCAHGTSSYHKAVAATCTTAGNTAYYSCNECGKLFSDSACKNQIALSQTIIAALGHKEGKYSSNDTYHWHLCAVCGAAMDDSEKHQWNDGVVTVQPTETVDGLRVYTCTTCSKTKNETIPMLGTKLSVSFVVPAGLTVPATLSGYKGDTVVLPEYSAVPEEGYTFVGWTAESVNHSTVAGSYYKAGASYTLDANTTLRALYTYKTTSGGGSGAWTWLQSDSELKAGMQLILACNDKGVTAGSHNTSYLSKVSSTFSEDLSVLEAPGAGTVILTLGGEADAWTLSNAEGELLGASANKNVKWGAGVTTWKISISEGVATIQNTTSSYGRFLYNVSATRFTTYTSATSSSMRMPQLYSTEGMITTTYYTTEYEVESTEPTLDESIKIYHTLDLASDISVTFAVPKTSLTAYDSYYLEVVLPEYNGNTQTGTATVRVEPVLNSSYYYFTLTGITAVRMGDLVDATLHMTKDGKEYISKTDKYSVATYAYAML